MLGIWWWVKTACTLQVNQHGFGIISKQETIGCFPHHVANLWLVTNFHRHSYGEKPWGPMRLPRLPLGDGATDGRLCYAGAAKDLKAPKRQAQISAGIMASWPYTRKSRNQQGSLVLEQSYEVNRGYIRTNYSTHTDIYIYILYIYI